MAIKFPKKQEQRLIPKYLLEYATDLQENHPDPTADWGGGSGVADIEAGTGIEITGETTKTISVDDETVAMVANLAPVAFSGSYNDLSNTPSIPTNTSDLNNDSGFIASGDDDPQFTNSITLVDDTVYPRYATTIEKGFTNDNTVVTLPDYNGTLTTEDYVESLISKEWPIITIDLINMSISQGDLDKLITKWPKVIAQISGNYQAETKYLFPYKSELYTYYFVERDINIVADPITSEQVTHVVQNVYSINDMGHVTFIGNGLNNNYNDLANLPVLFDGDYNSLTNKPTIPTKTSDLTNDSNFIPSNEFNTKPYMFYANGFSKVTYENTIYYNNGNGYSVLTFPIKNAEATIATTDDIPTNVSQLTNDSGFITSAAIPTNVSSFTNDAGYITSSALPTNYVTTNTAQDITNVKTFVGPKLINLKQNQSADKLGFTCYNYLNNEKGYLEYNPSDDGMYLGRYGTYRVNELGFKTSVSGAGTHKLLVPNITLTTSRTDYIPISVNGTRADSTGDITISIPTVPTNVSAFTNDAGYITGITDTMINTALGYTAADASDVPSTATSTSTVTPSTSAFVTGTSTTTETLTFTYTDNTTANITIVTSVTDSTSNAMTGATVSTTTTLS